MIRLVTAAAVLAAVCSCEPLSAPGALDKTAPTALSQLEERQTAPRESVPDYAPSATAHSDRSGFADVADALYRMKTTVERRDYVLGSREDKARGNQR